MQGGDYKNKVNKYAAERGFESSPTRILFQQKGLNELNKKSFQSYARVIIETTLGKDSEYVCLNDSTKFTTNEINALTVQFNKQLIETFKSTENHLIEWKETTPIILNGQHGIKVSYLRQFEDKPYAHVNTFYFQNNDRMHVLTFSYREEEFATWEPLFSKSLMSFKITNVR